MKLHPALVTLVLAVLSTAESHAISLAVTLKDRVAASKIIAEVVIEDCQVFRDPHSSTPIWEAEMTCKVTRLLKGPKGLKTFPLRVQVFNKQTNFTGKVLLVFAFQLEDKEQHVDELRAFDGMNGLITIGADFWDLSPTPDPKTGSYMHPLSYKATIDAVAQAVKEEAAHE